MDKEKFFRSIIDDTNNIGKFDNFTEQELIDFRNWCKGIVGGVLKRSEEYQQQILERKEEDY